MRDWSHNMRPAYAYRSYCFPYLLYLELERTCNVQMSSSRAALCRWAPFMSSRWSSATDSGRPVRAHQQIIGVNNRVGTTCANTVHNIPIGNSKTCHVVWSGTCLRAETALISAVTLMSWAPISANPGRTASASVDASPAINLIRSPGPRAPGESLTAPRRRPRTRGEPRPVPANQCRRMGGTNRQCSRAWIRRERSDGD